MNVAQLEAEETPREVEIHRANFLNSGYERFETRHRRKDGTVWPVEISATYLKEWGDLCFAFLRDISERKDVEQQVAEYVRQLEASMEGTLRAVSQMVEHRDPYTAGHERRVGIIASDIARELGWSEGRCREMQLIGLVHDIGKIGVPTDILSKPGRLKQVEFELVKEHVDRGYEILKHVKFAAPIAEIIRQHHERMDGSGYPRCLVGYEILPEARILAVADILESMVSHRPYRPAFDTSVALAEIKTQRGTRLDVEVVDALFSLIDEKGYQLPA